MAAGGAAIVAEMAEIGRGVFVRRPAADAVLRVGGMLEGGTRMGGVVDAEGDGPGALSGQVADLRIVGVHDEAGLRRERAHGAAPALGDVLELPVTVELIAEEVPQAEHARPDPRGHLRQRRLVDLEQPELRAPGLEQGRGDPGHEVRAGPVVGEAVPRAEDLRGHRRGRRLAVRGRDQRRAAREARGEPVDRPRIELPEQLPRHGRAATGAGEAGKASRRPRDGDLGGERDRQAHDA